MEEIRLDSGAGRGMKTASVHYLVSVTFALSIGTYYNKWHPQASSPGLVSQPVKHEGRELPLWETMMASRCGEWIPFCGALFFQLSFFLFSYLSSFPQHQPLLICWIDIKGAILLIRSHALPCLIISYSFLISGLRFEWPQGSAEVRSRSSLR